MREIFENFKKMLLSGTAGISSIEDIGDFFEFGDSHKDELIQFLPFMISCICSTLDEDVKEGLLWSVHQAIIYNGSNIAVNIDWDSLIPCLPQMNDENKDYVLSFLGVSGKEKYIPLLNEYLQYPNSMISATAQEALSEINYRNRKRD